MFLDAAEWSVALYFEYRGILDEPSAGYSQFKSSRLDMWLVTDQCTVYEWCFIQ